MMNENEIREVLISHLSMAYSNENDIAFIKELFVDNFACRADLVVANGKLTAFEIKSEFDNLNRLAGQLTSFTAHFEETTVVCASKHLNKVKLDIDPRVGIILICEDKKLKTIRKAKKNRLPKAIWLSHLPVDELKHLLKHNVLSQNGVREDLIERITKKVSYPKIRTYVIDYFKRRELKINILKKKRHALTCRSKQRNFNMSTYEALFMGSKKITPEEINHVLPRKSAKNQNPRPLQLQIHSKVS